MIHYPKRNLHLKWPTDSFGNQMLNDGHKRKLSKTRFQVLLLHIRFDTFLITHYEIEKNLKLLVQFALKFSSSRCHRVGTCRRGRNLHLIVYVIIGVVARDTFTVVTDPFTA